MRTVQGADNEKKTREVDGSLAKIQGPSTSGLAVRGVEFVGFHQIER